MSELKEFPIRILKGTFVYPLMFDPSGVVKAEKGILYRGLTLITSFEVLAHDVELGSSNFYVATRPYGALPAFYDSEKQETRCITSIGPDYTKIWRVAEPTVGTLKEDLHTTYVRIDDSAIDENIVIYKKAIYDLANKYVYVKFPESIRDFWGYGLPRHLCEVKE